MVKYGLIACLIVNASICMQPDNSERKNCQSRKERNLKRQVSFAETNTDIQSPTKKQQLIDQDTKHTKEEREISRVLDLLAGRREDLLASTKGVADNKEKGDILTQVDIIESQTLDLHNKLDALKKQEMEVAAELLVGLVTQKKSENEGDV